MRCTLQFLLLFALAGGVLVASEPAFTSYAVTPASADEIVLFGFDNYSIPSWRNLRLTMHPPDKYADDPVIRRGGPGAPDESSAQFYGSILEIGGKYRMWYLGINPRSNGYQRPGHPISYKYLSICYAESSDGVHWTKPDLGLVEFGGNKHNNIVELAPWQPGSGNALLLYEPQDPDPDRRYKLMLLVYADVAPIVQTILPFFSRDGLHWRQAVSGTFNSDGQFDRHATVLPLDYFEMGGLYHFQGTYYAAGQQRVPYTWLPDGSPSGRVMSVFRSSDFVHWSDTSTQAFIRWGYHSAPINEGEESHMPAASWNRGNVILSIYGQLHGAPHSRRHPLDLGFLISNDGVHFREPIHDYAFLRHDPDSAWQSGGLVQGQGFFNRGDQTYIYFSGWDGDVTDYKTRAEIGLATLRRDGFGSLSPMRAGMPAAFVTCALAAGVPSQLGVNVAGLSGSAELKFELLDEAERPLPGYSGADAARVDRSGLDQPVRWGRGSVISASSARFKIRVSYEGRDSRDIHCYALYLKPARGFGL